MARAIIEIVGPDAYFDTALAVARRVDAGESVAEADFHLGYRNATQLFGELTPSRLALLETLKGLGPVPIHALAEALGRDPGEVDSDIRRLREIGLVDRDTEGEVEIPWERIEIRVTLGADAAA
jgi:predicted transcriptional regulator